MSLLKEITDKTAAVAWSPCKEKPGLIALGSKEGSGSGFDNVGGELAIYDLDFAKTTDKSCHAAGTVKASARFTALAWSEMKMQKAAYPLGPCYRRWRYLVYGNGRWFRRRYTIISFQCVSSAVGKKAVWSSHIHHRLSRTHTDLERGCGADADDDAEQRMALMID
jgi:hypothetical protein